MLGKFIYRPVVLTSIDDDDFGELSAQLVSALGDQHDREAVASCAAAAARDFEGSLRAGRKELLERVRVLGVSGAIAEKNHAGFEVARLPGMQKAIGGRQC